MNGSQMQENFREQVQRSFGGLIRAFGFRVHEAAYDPHDFGNAIVVLESDDYSIRIVRDRDQVFVDVASPEEPGMWIQLGRLLEAAGIAQAGAGFGGSIDLATAAATLAANHQVLSTSLDELNYAATRGEVERLGALAKEEFLRRLSSR